MVWGLFFNAMNICVFSASREDLNRAYIEAAKDLGARMAERGWGLVFGGGMQGLMGHCARAVHAGGGRVVGIIPERLNRPGVTYEAADELIVTHTLRERKHEMDRRSDAFVALPGGFGTLEEVVETIALKQLGYHNRPIVLMNTAAFYSPLLRFFEHQVEENFVKREYLDLYAVAETPEAAVDYINGYLPESVRETIPGFDRFEHGGRVALARHEYADTVMELFFGPGIASEVASKSGRGAVYTFDLADGKGILRPYRRGGVLAKYREDRYWRSNRPLKELIVLEHAFKHALPVPQPLGVLWEQTGQSFTGAIATRYLPGISLQEWAANHAPDEDDGILSQCGRAIREMHSAGIYHADLQIRNIIVGEGKVYIIDFDKSSRIDPFADMPRARNLLRLRRSIEKNGLPTAYFEAIVKGYGGIDLPVALRAAYRLKSLLSDALRRGA